MEILNRKANYEYDIIETIEAGIVLVGSEIKSIREGRAQLKDSYAIVKNEEAMLLNMHISKYDKANQFNHDETRTRKLLLHKKEILKLQEEVSTKGYTLIPLKLYFKGNNAKILLGLAKGRKNYDKREAIKNKDIKREMAKEFKQGGVR